MLRGIFDVIAGRRPEDLQTAFVEHREAVDRRVDRSRRSAGIVRDVRENATSVIETLKRGWET